MKRSSKFEVIALKALSDNYIWVIRSAGMQGVWVVDPGEAAPVLSWLEAQQETLVGIMLTHHHLDHVQGVPALQACWPKARLVLSRASPLPWEGERVGEGDEVSDVCSDLTWRVWEIPGHTQDHVCFIRGHHAWVGDTLFHGGCGRCLQGTPQQLWKSLQRILALPDETWCYPAHEYTLSNLEFARLVLPNDVAIEAAWQSARACRDQGLPTLPTRLAEQRRMNVFLRVHEPLVQQRLRDVLGVAVGGAEDAFVCLRAWKDSI